METNDIQTILEEGKKLILASPLFKDIIIKTDINKSNTITFDISPRKKKIDTCAGTIIYYSNQNAFSFALKKKLGNEIFSNFYEYENRYYSFDHDEYHPLPNGFSFRTTYERKRRPILHYKGKITANKKVLSHLKRLLEIAYEFYQSVFVTSSDDYHPYEYMARNNLDTYFALVAAEIILGDKDDYGEFDKDRIKVALDMLKIAYEDPSYKGQACYFYGYYVYEKHGIYGAEKKKADLEKAFEYYQEGATLGNQRCQEQLKKKDTLINPKIDEIGEKIISDFDQENFEQFIADCKTYAEYHIEGDAFCDFLISCQEELKQFEGKYISLEDIRPILSKHLNALKDENIVLKELQPNNYDAYKYILASDYTNPQKSENHKHLNKYGFYFLGLIISWIPLDYSYTDDNGKECAFPFDLQFKIAKVVEAIFSKEKSIPYLNQYDKFLLVNADYLTTDIEDTDLLDSGKNYTDYDSSVTTLYKNLEAELDDLQYSLLPEEAKKELKKKERKSEDNEFYYEDEDSLEEIYSKARLLTPEEHKTIVKKIKKLKEAQADFLHYLEIITDEFNRPIELIQKRNDYQSKYEEQINTLEEKLSLHYFQEKEKPNFYSQVDHAFKESTITSLFENLDQLNKLLDNQKEEPKVYQIAFTLYQKQYSLACFQIFDTNRKMDNYHNLFDYYLRRNKISMEDYRTVSQSLLDFAPDFIQCKRRIDMIESDTGYLPTGKEYKKDFTQVERIYLIQDFLTNYDKEALNLFNYMLKHHQIIFHGSNYGVTYPCYHQKKSIIMIDTNSRLSDVSTLAHEFGHAFNFYQLYQNEKPKDPTAPMAEVSSLFFELCFADYCLKNKEKYHLHEADIIQSVINNILSLNMFDGLKQTIYLFDLSEKYKETNAPVPYEEMNELYKAKTLKTFGFEGYGVSTIFEDRRFYEEPFYGTHYMFGSTIASLLLLEYKKNKELFLKRYKEALKKSGETSPFEFLKEVGINYQDQSTFDEMVAYYKNLLHKFLDSTADMTLELMNIRSIQAKISLDKEEK